VPCLHAGIFLVPLAMRAFLPDGYNAAWLTVFTLETILYAVGTAFIVMLMVKDHHVHVYRTAACTDHLTGLLNRRTFLDNALALCAKQGKRSEPVAMLMFDLDYFKSINDRFGHAAGDEVLRVFGRVVRASTRMDDIIGRFGGEEFIAIVPGGLESANKIAERVRASFESAGVTIANHAIAGRCRALPRQARGPESSAYRRRGNGSRAGAPDRRCTPSPCPAHAGFCKNFAAQHGRLIDGPLGASDRNLSFTLFAVPYGHVAFAESCPQRCRHA
jgi:diguanylate cyclase (GGDEF)-like protein